MEKLKNFMAAYHEAWSKRELDAYAEGRLRRLQSV